MGGYSAASGGTGAGAVRGGARPQTAEIVKTFGERCPDVLVNNIQEKADYIVLLDHEGGKGVLQHKNKVAVFARVSGDSVVSKSTLSLGGSVQEACGAIKNDWAAHGPAMRAATLAAATSKVSDPQPVVAVHAMVATPATGKVSVVSVPDGADIEVDGNFVGNTPSDVQVPEGDHAIAVRKAGFKDWGRRMKVSGGSSVRLNAELEKMATQ
jgi:protein-tyrosine-phosphatase